MTTVIMLQKKIVKALEDGKDTTPILKELAELRAKQALDGELVELTKVADQKKEYRARAETIKAKVGKQDKAIASFLEARDTLIKQLEPLLEPMTELEKLGASSWEREPGECYLYNDLSVFGADVRSVPDGYLKDIVCPFLEMAGGQIDARGKASEAYQYLGAAVGILKGFQKGVQRVSSGKAANPLIENVDVAGNCIVCQSPEREAIDKAIKEGRPLRTIETEFRISRSSLSRHKSNCLNQGVIRDTTK